MPILVLGILFVWTIAVFRLICFRTTLGPRTLLTFVGLGALLGTVVNPLAEKFFNSYRYDGNQLYVLLIVAVQHLFMVAPVLLLLSKPAWRRGSSVCDAFLAAFAIGAGYEFFGALLALAPSGGVAAGLSFLPPGVASATTATVAGYAYWSGLVALVCGAGFRFLRNPFLAYGAASIALLLCALDHYADLYNGPTAEKIGVFTLHGALLPWFVLLLLAGTVVWEMRWTKSKSGIKDAVAEFQAVAPAIVTLKFSQAKLAGAGHHLRRQKEILEAELRREPGNAQIQRQLESIQASLTRLASIAPSPQTGVVDWLKRRWVQILAVMAFLFLGVFIEMPGMGTLANWIWTSLPLAARFAPFQLTLLATVLVGLLVWEYVKAPRQAFSPTIADEVAQFSAERRILQLGLGVVLLAVLYPHPGEFIAFQSNLASGANLRVPGFDEEQALTLVLLLAWAVGGLTAQRSELWQKKASGDHLRNLVHNFVTVCGAATVAWLAFAFFTQIQIYAHANWGARFFNYFQANGNSVLEMVLGLFTVVFSFAAAWLVRVLAARFEKTFLAAAGGPSRSAGATAAGAGK
jgi:hypothetical protein